MKPVTYDKKRIVSTVIIGIFVLLALFVALSCAPLTWAALKEAAEQQKEQGSGAEQVAVVGALALVLALGMALAIVAYFGVIITCGICLPFAIMNRRSTLKPVRIISYVYDGLIGALLLLSIIKLILIFAGV